MSSVRNVFRIPELRNKILFTIFIIALYRLGAHVPVPGISIDQVKRLQDSAGSNGIVGFKTKADGVHGIVLRGSLCVESGAYTAAHRISRPDARAPRAPTPYTVAPSCLTSIKTSREC